MSADRFAELRGFEAEAARRRGWWLGRIEQEAPAQWRLTFCFPSGASRTVTLRRAELTPADVSQVAEALLVERRRAPRGGRPSSSSSRPSGGEP